MILKIVSYIVQVMMFITSIEDKELRIKYGNAGRVIVEKRFAIDNVVKETINVFKKDF